MRVLMVDNYDSFTWNLVHYLEEMLEEELTVYRNDDPRLENLDAFDRIVLSPGPGLPKESAKLMDVIQYSAGRIPLLGICLGLQAITEHYGGTLKQLREVMHGLQRNCSILKNDPLFEGINSPFPAGRYHSWVADPATFPDVLEILAEDDEQQIMAIKHRSDPVYALQFHPESILTPAGKRMLKNWLTV